MTPIKALKSGATLMMRTPTDDAAWVAKYQATTERLKTKEATAKVGASTQEVARVGDAAQEPEPVEAAPGCARLDVPSIGGLDAGKEEEQPELQPEREEPRPQPQQD
jgi:hypothetical protein